MPEKAPFRLESVKKDASKHITFRAPGDVAEALDREAKHLGIPTSSLLNSILQKWARWDRHAQKMGVIPVPRDVFMEVISGVSEKQIHGLVEKSMKTLKDSVMAMKGGYDLRRCVSTLEEYMRATGLASDHTVAGGTHRFTVRHDMGIIWSLFIKSVMEQLFGQFVPDKKVSFDMSDGTVVVSVELGSDWDEHDY